MNIRIVVATHKAYDMPREALYLPMQAGAACNVRLDYAGDDTGENISARNDQYCELTTLYWAWKNLPGDAIGLCHYRRYFKQPDEKRPVDDATLQRLLSEAPVILPKKRNYWIETGENQFVHAHGSEGLEALRVVLRDVYPEYVAAFEESLRRTKGHRFNMLIMRREQLDAYCEWLFGVLFEAEKRIQAPKERLMGFLAERLLDAWIETAQVPYLELPVYHTEKTNWLKKGGIFLLRKMRG